SSSSSRTPVAEAAGSKTQLTGVVGAFAIGAIAVLAAATRCLGSAEFGAANRVTLLRGAMVALVFGLVAAEPAPERPRLAVVVATVALILDGVDGSLARRVGAESAFGARFDMETDAIAVLVLALLVWHFDKAGAWIVLSGLMRYGFAAAAWVAPWMARPLPPSRRRKAVCVAQLAALLLCLAPIVPAGVSVWVAAASLVALVGSFAADVAWLARWRGDRKLASPG
ncbi:MAG: CDP-alcohol phosphatidyltransferase family protein, partial [Gammaproteobacteria bacterium]|nr:CDP-alcohol phosphatidyltransferase family protein [Gammaproteobacteria bacterium]